MKRAWTLIRDMRGAANFGQIEALESLHQNVADLRPIDMQSMYLAGIQLPKADLHGANFAGTNFRDANLQETNLREVQFQKGIFSYLTHVLLIANPQNVDLYRSNLRACL